MFKIKIPASYIFVPALLGANAGAWRYALRFSVESRLQILFFWALAAAIEFWAEQFGLERSRARFAISATVTAAAILTAKFYLEGARAL